MGATTGGDLVVCRCESNGEGHTIMQRTVNRRRFVGTTAAASLSTLAIGAAPRRPVGGKRPIVVASGNGLRTVEKAMELLKKGHDPLDAAIEGVAIVEADPKDHSVGYGGLPNEDGVVELDAAVMHGPTHGGGSVASIRNIMHPAAVARVVMQRTPALSFGRRGCACDLPGRTVFPRSIC